MANRMLPIHGQSKAKRLVWGTPQNYISWAFMRELREHNKTCKVYDCNPYVEVYQFRDNLYGLFNQNCDGAGDVWTWLIVGPEKCMLIDTAFGLGDSRALVEEISGGKEIIVVNTHDHFDHAFGNCRFDRVYCHKDLVPLLEQQNPHMWDYLFDGEGNNRWLAFDRADLPEYRPYEITGVEDGYIFDLGGGYEVELINSGGHGGPGAAMYLDKQNRILFPGDNVCSDISGCGEVSYPIEECLMHQFYVCICKLCQRIDEFDWLFPMHFMVNLDSYLLMDVRDTVEKILADPEHAYDYPLLHKNPNGGPDTVRLFKYVPGFTTIAYTVNEKASEIVPAALRHAGKRV